MTHCQRLLRVPARGDLGKWRWGIKSRGGEWLGKISHLDQAQGDEAISSLLFTGLGSLEPEQ